MTTTASPGTSTAAVGARGRDLTGTRALVRLALRRDRIKLPAWTLGIGLFVLYYATALPALFATEADLQAAGQLVEGPVGAVLSGPGYGFDDLTIERFLVGQYGLYFLLAAALMNILLVSRHTRVEEQTGRAELVRASVVGRHAPLTATLFVAAIGNVAVTLLVAATMMASGFDAGGSLLFGAGIGAVGLAFAGVTALTVQVTEYSRAASGLAGATLGAAFVIRAAGDLITQHGSLVSWFSPLAWSQQTRAFVDDRWWPLLLSLLFAAAAAGVGYRLSTRRDLGAGLVAARSGAAHAAPWLRSPLALALRLQRASLIGWSAGLTAAGLIYGGLTQPIVDGFEAMSDEVLAMMGGSVEQPVNGYLSVMALFMALVVGVFAVLAVQGVRAEESRGRAEPVLATATSRSAWLGSHLVVTAVGAVWLLAVAGVTTGIGAALGTGDAGLAWDVTLAHLAHTPAVLVVLALAALLFGLAPRAVPVAWAALLYGMIIGFFGPVMDLPAWVMALSPFDHIAQMPLAAFDLTPVVTLTAIAAAVAAAGLLAFRTRDLATT